MDLRVTFGWHLDGSCYADQKELGYVLLGPLALLRQLALRIGLLSRFPEQAVRIAEFLSALRAADNGKRFYSKSFAIDGWGTARSLLRLRDELVAAGWKSTTHECVSDRIQTLAEIEKLTQGKLNCLSDLLCPVAEALETGASVPIVSIELLDREEYLPPIWRRILRALAANGTLVFDRPVLVSTLTNDATKLAQALNSSGVSRELQEVGALEGDESLTIIESDDEVQAADFFASWLAESYDELNEQTVIIRGEQCSFLDSLLHKQNLPALGSAVPSKYRSGLQLLTLAIDMSWKPVNPTRIIELLMMPNSPIPRYAAECFIQALKIHPGIGGPSWKDAWSKALNRLRVALEKDMAISSTDLLNKLKESEIDWKAWLEPPRHSTVEGIGVQDLVSVCNRIRHYALKVFHKNQQDVYQRVADNAETLSTAILVSGLTKITRAQLDRILDSVISDGYVADKPEASAWSTVAHPGQIVGTLQTVIWWGFVDNVNRTAACPWTDQETAELAKADVIIEQPMSQMLREAYSWRRPFTTHVNRVMFIRPRTIAGEETLPHPFFHEFAELIDRAPNSVRSKIVKQAHLIYQSAETELCQKIIRRQKVLHAPFRNSKQVLSIKPGIVEPQKESPSSLEKLFGCPLAWLLQRKVQLKYGHMLNIAEGEQLYGNLAHAVFAEVLQNFSYKDCAIDQLAEQTFDLLCPQIAAPLLQPGKGLERQNLKRSVSDAATHLMNLILTAGYTKIHCEQEHHTASNSIELTGRADIFLEHIDDEDFVLDLKWTKRPSNRRLEIADGRAVQLAIYAWMISGKTGRKTNAGYYMLNQRQLFSTARKPFPMDTFVPGPSLSDTFEQIIASYEQHMRYLQEGVVYVTGIEESLTATKKSTRPYDKDAKIIVPGTTISIEPPCSFCSYAQLCGKQEMDN